MRQTGLIPYKCPLCQEVDTPIVSTKQVHVSQMGWVILGFLTICLWGVGIIFWIIAAFSRHSKEESVLRCRHCNSEWGHIPFLTYEDKYRYDDDLARRKQLLKSSGTIVRKILWDYPILAYRKIMSWLKSDF